MGAQIARVEIKPVYGEGSSQTIVASLQDSGFKDSEFELLLRFYMHFWTNAHWERYEHPYPTPSYWLNSITVILLQGWL